MNKKDYNSHLHGTYSNKRKTEKSPAVQKADGSDTKYRERTKITIRQQIL